MNEKIVMNFFTKEIADHVMAGNNQFEKKCFIVVNASLIKVCPEVYIYNFIRVDLDLGVILVLEKLKAWSLRHPWH